MRWTQPLLLMMLAWPSFGGATTFPVNFCVEYNVDYADVDAGEDFWWNNSANKIARGIRIRVQRNSDGWNAFYDYADYNGSGAGCTGPITLDDSEDYLVRVYSEAEVGGNYIRVRNNPTNESRFYYTYDSDFVPSSTATVTVVTANHAAWRIAAAAGYSQYRRRGGMTGKTYILYDEALAACGGSCVPPAHNRIYMAPQQVDEKFTIVHEMGHSLARFKNGGGQPLTNDGGDGGDCGDSSVKWWYNTNEFQSLAATEGFAEFYAALVFNDDGESDCFLHVGGASPDWDLDGVGDSQLVNCELGPVDGLSPSVTLDPEVDHADYLGDMCSDTSTDNRATVYDWVRFWWDYSTDDGTYFTDCAAIWNTADPNTWGSGGGCVGAACPYVRLQTAASLHPGSSGVDFADTAEANGVHRQ